MQVKQKNIRAFEFTVNEIDDEKELLQYVDKNLELLKNFLISIIGELTEEAKFHLEKNGLTVVFAKHLTNTEKKSAEKIISGESSKKEENNKIITYDNPIRSGNKIECNDDVIMFKRINSGAKIIARKNAIILATIDGDVEASGDYLVVRNIGKGVVVFNGEEVKRDLVNGRLFKITTKKGLLDYEELL